MLNDPFQLNSLLPNPWQPHPNFFKAWKNGQSPLKMNLKVIFLVFIQRQMKNPGTPCFSSCASEALDGGWILQR
jgi:hypothetical protein